MVFHAHGWYSYHGSLAELKGFEIKRRGELQIVKLFQGEVFEKFLNGETIEECYEAVGEVGSHWLNILLTEGKDLEDEELIDLISENKNMSKTMEEYGDRKSTSITVAKRFGQFLGAGMIKDKGLNCRRVISKYPSSWHVCCERTSTCIGLQKAQGCDI